MIRSVYLIFEFATYALAVGCIWHAARQSRYRVLEFLFSVVYGVLLEWITLRQLEAYHYGRFLIMLDDAPLTIGVGWGVIIYSAMEFSNRLQMPEAARPLLDALLALNIDLAMDTVAIRLGMWTWGVLELHEEWFGVPWANFWAWFIVVSSYSAFVRALRGWQAGSVRRWLYVPLAFLLSLGVLALTNELFRSVIVNLGGRFTGPLVLIGSGLFIVLSVRPRVLHAGPPEPVVIAVPLVFHLLFIGAGIFEGIYAGLPALAVVGVGMLLIGMAVHLWPWWVWRKRSAVGDPHGRLSHSPRR